MIRSFSYFVMAQRSKTRYACQDHGYPVDPHGYLSKILARYSQELQDVMVRSYQESHVPKKNFIAKSYLNRKKTERKSTKTHLCRFTLLDMTRFC